jgi:hypothetical protein
MHDVGFDHCPCVSTIGFSANVREERKFALMAAGLIDFFGIDAESQRSTQE